MTHPANVDSSDTVIRDPFQGCFLCDPEPWRVIVDRPHVRLIAGLGPLCPGYVILASRKHVYTTAELPEETFIEFLDTASRTAGALRRQYGAGFTAYEHARIGACYDLELRQDFSTFCHHCHRVFIPKETCSLSRLAVWLSDYVDLAEPHAIRELHNRAYVYYETGSNEETLVRRGYTTEHPLPSQFMRRILSDELGLGRSWDWSVDPRYDEMLDTVHRLRPELVTKTSNR